MVNTFKPVQSLQRGLALLDLMARARQGATLKELAAAAGCSTPAVHHLVLTLVDAGYAQRLENPVRYLLGPRLLTLAQHQADDRFYQLVDDHMIDLQRRLPGAGVYFSEYLGNHVTVRAEITPADRGQVRRTGSHVLPPYVSAGSVVHLAWWPMFVRESYVQAFPYPAYGELFWGPQARFERVLAAARRDGFVLMPERSPLHLKLGLPVFGRGGALLAALTVQWNQADNRHLARQTRTLQTTALEVGRRLAEQLEG
jgi:DNA-binding IclR family transcriptional regulator